MDNIKYGPEEMKGREFKGGDDYIWVYMVSRGQPLYGKIQKDDFDKATQGQPFMLWHPHVNTPQGFAYLPANSGTLEPFFVADCGVIAFVHYKIATMLDSKIKEEMEKSDIVVATEAQVPKFHLTKG